MGREWEKCPISLSQGRQNFPKDLKDLRGMSDQWPRKLLQGLAGKGGGYRVFISSLSFPEDKADPGHSEISATRCPKVPGRVLVHTSVSPSPDNLHRFAVEHEASEQVEIYLWKLVKGEHRPTPSRAYFWPVPLTRGLRGPCFVDHVPLAQEDLPLATLPNLSL